MFRRCMELLDQDTSTNTTNNTTSHHQQQHQAPVMSTKTMDSQVMTMLQSIISRLDVIEGKMSTGPMPPSSTKDVVEETISPADVMEESASLSPAVTAYEIDVMETLVQPLVLNLNSIHKDGIKLSEPIQLAFQGIAPIISAASKSKKPTDLTGALLPMLKPVQDAAGKIRKLRLSRELDNNQKSVEAMVACLSWVVVEKTPVPFVKETLGAAEYYSNKIRREFKNKETGDAQVSFCDQLKGLVLGLADYIKAYHLTGLSFNPKGGDFDTSVESPKPITAQQADPPAAAPAVGGINGIMAELKLKQTSTGDSAATGLRKVTKDMQTWRNEYKTSNDSTLASSSAPKPSNKAPTKLNAKEAPLSKLPVCKFVNIGSKWIVEYQTKELNTSTTNNNVITIDIDDPKKQVYIYKCENVTVDVKGKCKGIVIDGCKRVNVLFDDIISVVELVNCKNVAVQTRGVVPNISIDKTAGCMVYLSKASVGVTSFVTSTSSEMNVSWPTGDSDDDLIEKPIPEQFLHTIVGSTITSEVSELYS